MRIDDYAKWLRTLVSEAVVQNYIKRCQRVEKNLDVSLDLEFRKHRGFPAGSTNVYDGRLAETSAAALLHKFQGGIGLVQGIGFFKNSGE